MTSTRGACNVQSQATHQNDGATAWSAEQRDKNDAQWCAQPDEYDDQWGKYDAQWSNDAQHGKGEAEWGKYDAQ